MFLKLLDGAKPLPDAFSDCVLVTVHPSTLPIHVTPLTTVRFCVANAEILKLALHVVNLPVIAPPNVNSGKQANATDGCPDKESMEAVRPWHCGLGKLHGKEAEAGCYGAGAKDGRPNKELRRCTAFAAFQEGGQFEDAPKPFFSELCSLCSL